RLCGLLGDVSFSSVRAPPRLGLRRQRIHNLFSVESSVLNETFAGVPPANHHSSQMNPRHVAFQRVGIESRLARFRIEPHSQTFDERKIRMIPRQSEHLARRQTLFAAPIAYNHLIRRNLVYPCLEHSL